MKESKLHNIYRPYTVRYLLIVSLIFAGHPLIIQAQQNQLQYEKSPYLLQHADNPVDWYPWGEDAFRKAEQLNKPIFLSIGYSTCYWCHVMERKVFMDEEIAAKMNEYFINIKVDREERPDVDRVYMSAVRALTGGGGWPMSVFLTPDLKPFFGATYIPPYSRKGRPGFSELIDRINSVWKESPDQVKQQAGKVTDHIQANASPDYEHKEIHSGVPSKALQWFEEHFDRQYGGFGEAPKFPRPATLQFLLQHYEETGSQKARDMAVFTLHKIADGGIYDQLGHGFHRYSTDSMWQVPHFEKMLYNQALLAETYLKAYQLTNEPKFLRIAREILDFTEREFYHPEGGFYSALNAESPPPDNPEGEEEEGVYYLWRASELAELIPEEYDIFAFIYGIKKEGNANHDPHGVFKGLNILSQEHTAEEAALHFGLEIHQIDSLLTSAEKKLLRQRKKRPAPSLDDKILLSWNGLMIATYAKAYQIFKKEHYKKKAEQTVEFLLQHLYDPETEELKRRFREGEPRFSAMLSDYAFFVKGLMALYGATKESKWLNMAKKFTDKQIDLFYDTENGAFFDTYRSDKKLLIQTKEFHDGALPSGNSVTINNLIALHHLTEQASYRNQAIRSLEYFGTKINEHPQAMPVMLLAVEEYLNFRQAGEISP